MYRSVLPLLLLSFPALAEVSSQTVFFVQPDGRSYLLQRAIHSDSPRHRFRLPAEVGQKDLLQVSPARYEWNDDDESVNVLEFDSGGFSLLYPGSFSPDQLQQQRDGTWRFTSWNGERDRRGRFGYWYSPGDFDRYTFTWVVPENIEITRYRSNRNGIWTRHARAVSFYAEGVNNLTFEIDFRVHATATATPCPKVPEAVQQDCKTAAAAPSPVPPTPSLRAAKAPAPRAPAADPFARVDPEEDGDGDGVRNEADLCPNTPRGAITDRAGCALDTDRDGVPDGIDHCLDTPEGQAVNSRGCQDS